MPAQSSQGGQVIFRTQAVPGTYQSDTGTAGITMGILSGGLAANRDLAITDPEIGGSRDIKDATLGAVSYSGNYDLYPRLDAIPTLLKAALGVSTSVTTTGVTTHTITPADTALLPILSIEESIGASMEVFRYTDAVVNTFHLESDANGFVRCTVGIIAITQLAGAVRSTGPIVDTSSVEYGTNVNVITYNGTSLPAKSFSLDVNNNFDDSDFRLGLQTLGSLIPKRREVTVGMNVRNQDSSMWRQATNGSAAATGPGQLAAKQALVVGFQTPDTIVGGTPATNRSLQITIPSAIIKPYSMIPSGDDILDSDIEFEAVRPSNATPLLTALVKNGQAAIA